MSRVIPIGLAAHYPLRATTLCYVLKITRSIDNVSVGYTTLDDDITIAAFVYQRGLQISNIQTQSGLAVGNLDVNIFPDDNFSAADLIAGKWNGAVWVLGIANWKDLAEIDVVKTGKTGEAEINEQGTWKLEMRGLTQALQQPIGEYTQKTCKAELGDERCLVDLTPWTHDHVVTSVGSQHTLTASAAAEALDYYTEGSIKFLTGPNAPYRFKVKFFAAGSFTLQVATPFVVGVGDTFTAVAGCQKRWDLDCRDKFDNILNNQSEKDTRGSDVLLAGPDVGAGA